MKLKKLVSLLIVLTLVFSLFPIAKASASTEISTNSKMEYMDFVKAIDSAISETNDGYYIDDKKFIENYIHHNLGQLQTIKGFENFSEKDIYKHITKTIELNNKNYKENKIKVKESEQALISSGQYAAVMVSIPSGYHYERYGEYSNDCWWGVSKLFTNSYAMRVYARDLNAISTCGTITAAMCGILGWPAAFIGAACYGLSSIASDLNINSAYYDVLFCDIPWTIYGYSLYAG